MPSFQPMGIRAAATCWTPRSVAKRLNCEAALRVSATSRRMPRSLMCFRVSGETGMMFGPVPRIRRSRRGVSMLKVPGSRYLFRERGPLQTHQAWATQRPAAPSCVQPPPIDPCCCAESLQRLRRPCCHHPVRLDRLFPPCAPP